jgi:hypothetical protein
VVSSWPSTSNAIIIYTYDFPGSPGSGLAGNQTNAQPTGATFSDFTRSTVIGDTTGNAFGSKNWSSSGFLNPTTYTAFSITADAGQHLDLTSLTFLSGKSATGPGNSQVAMYVNGSSTAYATLNFTSTGGLGSYKPTTFDFVDLTDANNATTVTFKFYGWNAGSGGQFILDDVVTNGVITNAPEANPLGPVCLVVEAAILVGKMRRKPKAAKPTGPIH